MYMFTESNGQDRFIIPDFYCAEKKLIIEVDGSIHNQQDILNLDRVKQDLLEWKRLQVLRLKNEDVINNIDFVLQIIHNKLTK